MLVDLIWVKILQLDSQLKYVQKQILALRTGASGGRTEVEPFSHWDINDQLYLTNNKEWAFQKGVLVVFMVGIEDKLWYHYFCLKFYIFSS